MASRSPSLRGATTAASRIIVARRAAEIVRSPRALIESATTRRFPGGIRRLTNFFLTKPSTSREVAGGDNPSHSDTAERDVPGWLWMKASVRNCGTDRLLPRWRRICARIKRIAAGTASRISAAQSVGPQARTVAVRNFCILISSDKSTAAVKRAGVRAAVASLSLDIYESVLIITPDHLGRHSVSGERDPRGSWISRWSRRATSGWRCPIPRSRFCSRPSTPRSC